MKKRHPSPRIASMMEKFQGQEQSTTIPSNSKVTQKEQKSSPPPPPEKVAETRVSPPKPPHMEDRQQSDTTAQDHTHTHATPTPQRPPRTKDRQQSNTAAQDHNPTPATPAPQRPPRAKDRQQSNTAAQDHNPTPATPAPQRPPRAKDKQQRGASSQDDEGLYTTPAPSRGSTPIPKEELIDKIRSNSLVQTCKDEIKILSQTIYGNADIFQNKLEEIEKNPVLGESLSWQIAKNPALVASLAGKKVLGVKSKTRREAEEKVSHLCLAIENYSESVKKARENVLHGHLAKQTLHRQSMDLRQMAEDLQKPRKPEQEASLSHKELARRVRSNTLVEYCHAEIIYWCTIAYGDASILQYRLEEIEKSPATGEEIAWQVKTHPQLFGKLSGHDFRGLKSNARKQAENALTHLSDALEGYAEAIKHAQEHIVQTHEEKQKRHTQSTELDKSVSRQQTVSEPPQLPERSPINKHQQAVETAKHTEWDRLGARPRTMTTPEKHRQEGVLPTSHTEQKTQGEQKAENQQKSRKPEKTMAPLSHKEMSDRVQNDHSVQRARIEVYNWCKIVYNDPYTLQYNTEDIQKNPVLGEELSQQVANKPTMFAPLAGKQRFGVKNSTRREAEASLPSLCTAIAHYTETVKEVRKNIVQAHQAQQNHQRQSSEDTQDLQKQQVVPKTSRQHEHATVTAPNEAAETSIQEQQKLPDVRPRKVGEAKTMTFS